MRWDGRAWGAAAAAIIVGAAAMRPGIPLAAARPDASLPLQDGGARLRYVTEYPTCGGLRRTGDGPVPSGLRDLDRAGIARALAPAAVEISAGQVTVVRALRGCPGDTVTLVAQDGTVVVLAGPPGDNPSVLRATDIALRGLSPEDVERVAAGWGVPAADLSSVLSRLSAEAAGR